MKHLQGCLGGFVLHCTTTTALGIIAGVQPQ